MKKKLLSFVLAFAFILTTGICLTACGGKGDNTIKISTAQISDAGVTQMSLYYADFEEMKKLADENEEISETNKQIDAWNEEHAAEIASGEMQAQTRLESKPYNILRRGGDLYSVFSGLNTVSLNPSTYYLVVTLKIDQDYYIDGGLGDYALTLEVDDTTFQGLYVGNDSYGMPFSNCYFWMINKEISSNTTIKVKGNTELKAYTPFSNFVNYSSNPVYNDLMFKVSVDGTPIKYNDSEEIAVGNLLDAINASPARLNQTYHITCYFAGHNKFFTGTEMFEKFFNRHILPSGGLNGSELEVSWDFDRYNSHNPVTLDFSAFNGLTESDLSTVTFGTDTNAYEELLLIVDGVEKSTPTLTLAEYRNANDIKIRLKVSEGQIGDWPEQFTARWNWNKQFDSSRSDLYPGEDEYSSGYYYITINLGDYKSYTDISESNQNQNYLGLEVSRKW